MIETRLPTTVLPRRAEGTGAVGKQKNNTLVVEKSQSIYELRHERITAELSTY